MLQRARTHARTYAHTHAHTARRDTLLPCLRRSDTWAEWVCVWQQIAQFKVHSLTLKAIRQTHTHTQGRRWHPLTSTLNLPYRVVLLCHTKPFLFNDFLGFSVSLCSFYIIIALVIVTWKLSSVTLAEFNWWKYSKQSVQEAGHRTPTHQIIVVLFSRWCSWTLLNTDFVVRS